MQVRSSYPNCHHRSSAAKKALAGFASGTTKNHQEIFFLCPLVFFVANKPSLCGSRRLVFLRACLRPRSKE